MKRASLALIAAVAVVALTSGCATKNYVRQQVTPLVNKTDELNEMTAKNARDIRDVAARAQSGLQAVQAKSDAADQTAQQARQQADQAQTLASQTQTGVNSLTNVVANLDSYHPVVEAAVHFGFNRTELTQKAKDALDQLGQQIAQQKHYIITVEGGCDSVGSEQYNYELSQRRADAVIQYLAENYNVPAYRIYLIGLGKDKPVASNGSAAGRAKNRRVDVRLMTNEGGSEPQSSSSTGSPGASQQ